MSGYTGCACRDCFEVTVSADWTIPELCWECQDAGCQVGQSESCAYDCLVDGAYVGR